MKALLTTIIAICAFTLTCSAQWYAGGGANTYLVSTYVNVGIGNTNPTIPLQVGPGGVGSIPDGAGTAATPQVTNSQTSGASIISAAVLDGTNNRRIGLFVDQPNGLVGLSASYSTGAPAFVYRVPGAELFRITATGKVGIGTQNPDQALTVKGQVHSTTVVVTSTVPADYVFNNDYNLRPLADVKAFVDKNHHLPEVPSAADFKKDGQNLGEMNMTLLKKVEELTLYMIEQNKKTAELTAQVKAQQDEIERLKNIRR